MLSKLNFKYSYRSDVDRIYDDFYQPCLISSVAYDRAAGYFTSDSLKLIARGLEHLLFLGGKVRIVANPYLTQEDLEAIHRGERAKSDIIEMALMKEIEITAQNIEEDTLNVLAWLISNEQLEFKLAFTESNGLYHEKFGIFRDIEGTEVAFSGSANETVGGMKNNFEKIDVFTYPNDQQRIAYMVQDFESLWKDQTAGLEVKRVSKKVLDTILSYKKEKPTSKSAQQKEKTLKPREYQEKAIRSLKDHQWQGILDMATGTGKTKTSLFALSEYLQIHQRVFCIIIAPFTHLVNQWKEECDTFDFPIPTLCYQSRKKWEPQLEEEILDFNLELNNFHIVITTYSTAATGEFQKLIGSIEENVFLIADECHYFGASRFKEIQWDNISARIGLSATPDRWWDEEGTQFIRTFFGKIVYSYSLEQAIAEGKLTPYRYYPQVVRPTEEELSAYMKLTRRIIQSMNKKEQNDEYLQSLNRKRALILAKSGAKIPRLLALLREKGFDSIRDTLVYCAQGQVTELTKKLSALGLRVHQFDSKISLKDRGMILKRFATGDIQVLVAIKCLDEGVDVPSTRVAYFLASTSNPREFVQRRGRILRTYPGKHIAEIYDFIVLPEGVEDAIYARIARKELPRFAEFANSSLSPSIAKNEILSEISYYNLNHLMDMKPWDVYKEMKENYE